MAILELQRRYAEVGRIRLGEQRVSRNGKRYPSALATPKLTSPDRSRIEAVARLYGGTVKAYDSPSPDRWAVVIDRPDLPIMLPAATDVSQWFELWSAGGIARRCDGRDETVSGAACLCDPENRECQPTTRLNVILPEIPGLGTWRVEAHGWNAAVELPASVELLRAASADRLVPARLRVEARTVKRPDDKGDPQTRHFVVPVVDVDVSVAELLGSASPALPSPEGAADRPEAVGGPVGPSPALSAESRPVPPPLADQLAEADTLSGTTTVPIKRPGLPLRPAALAPNRVPAASPHGRREQSAGKGAGPGPVSLPVDPPLPADAQPPPPDEEDTAGLGPSHRRLMAAAADAFPDVAGEDRDLLRYVLTAAVTGGDRTSSRDLSATERDRVTDLMGRIVDGRAALRSVAMDRWEVSVPTPKGTRVADVIRLGDRWEVQTETVASS